MTWERLALLGANVVAAIALIIALSHSLNSSPRHTSQQENAPWVRNMAGVTYVGSQYSLCLYDAAVGPDQCSLIATPEPGSVTVLGPIRIANLTLVPNIETGSFLLTDSLSRPLVTITASATVIVGSPPMGYSPPSGSSSSLQICPMAISSPTTYGRYSLRTEMQVGLSVQNDACHIDIPTLCGTLYRTGEQGIPVFITPTLVIVGHDVPAGLILSNIQRSTILVQGNITFQSVTNLGSAVPCATCTPPPPTASTAPLNRGSGVIYLSYYPLPQETCAYYSVIQTHALPEATCSPLAALPNLRAVIAPVTAPAIVVRRLLDGGSGYEVSLFADTGCAQFLSAVTFTAGCSPARNYYFFFATS